MKKPEPPSDQAIAQLLERFNCPTPFAAARAVLMGSIASPVLDLSPVAAVEMLWDGVLPVFESAGDAQALFDPLIGGLWNRLATHQNSRHPFRLVRVPFAITPLGLQSLALMRQQEIAGFVDGLFGKEAQLHLPEKAHQSLQTLSDAYAMFSGAVELLADDTKPTTKQSLLEFSRHAQQMTAISEAHINKVIQACKRARAHHAEPMAMTPMDKDAFFGEPDEPFATSPLSQRLTRQGVTVQVEIYEDGQGKWILEVVDQEDASHVWSEHFVTDREALAAAIQALENEPLEFAANPVRSHDVH